MKELSVEEKAKRYDEAINRMKHHVVDEYGCSKIKVADIFPELKESEDEKTIKFIANELACIRATDEKGTCRYEELTKAIAWLEKQDNTKPRKYIEVASNVLVKLLESEKFQKDAREYLFDKGDKDLSGIYDIYAEEAVKYVKALYKQIKI